MQGQLFLCLMIGLAGQTLADDQVNYQRDIKPLLAEKCVTCHGALKQEAGLRLDAGVLIRKGGKDGKVVEPGNAKGSPLIHRVIAEDIDERMPPKDEGEPLNDRQVALISAWINAGAVVPKDEKIPTDPRKHWAYQLPKRPPLPEKGKLGWSHPIDAFIAREHQRLGLTPVDPADRHTLLRRAYMNLVGLPPTRLQVQAYLDDKSPQAFLKVVDALLKSPHHGERWGRHWMDVWRYSDWDGYKQQLRGSQRHIWHWRDWIIQSLNDDKGYDRMIVEMLAADEVAPNDHDILPATGFLARNYHKSNRNMWLDATVEHTAKAFLGMTLNCARCHDHKFDPLAQTAYYQFRAIFEPHNVRTDRLPGQSDLLKDGLPRAFDAELTAKTYLFLRGNDKHPDKENPMSPGVPAVLGGLFDIQPVDLPVDSYYPPLRAFVEQEQLTAAMKQAADARRGLRDIVEKEAKKRTDTVENLIPVPKLFRLKSNVAQLRVSSLKARYAAERSKFDDSPDTDAAKQKRKELAQKAASVEREFKHNQAELAVLQKQTALKNAQASQQKDAKKKQAAIAVAKKGLADAQKNLKTALANSKKTDGVYTPLGKEYPRTSSGRRLALARWIANEKNPLTARVAVNHIWLRHFGEPLVDNVFDFGLRSPKPRHADLLDWLAVELMEHKWSMKHVHRLILTSRTWQLASSMGQAGNPSVEVDRDNRFLWRMNVRRMDAEIIRDNVLAVTGHLDPTTGGADIDYKQGEVSRRRSIYLRHAYEKQMTMLVLFDAASPNECYRRSESIIPQQALALSNSSLSLGQSRLLARQLWQEVSKESKPQSRFVAVAFEQILSRPPVAEELDVCLKFLIDQAATLSDLSKLTTFAGGANSKIKPATNPQQRALENLVLVLMNHNDFVTVR